jgi:probable phosphoglycerate mutase
VLVRHGQGHVNVIGRIGGVKGCTGLTDLGRAQVGALAHRLSQTGELSDATALYASILPRAIETAEIIAPALGLRAADVIQDCGLCELHPGEADDLIWEEYAERYGVPDWDVDPTVPMAPGGESWVSFVDRSSAALEAVALRHPDERIVIATHAGVIESSMISFLVGAADPLHRPRLRLPTIHASMTEWERSESGWRLLRYNDASHAGAAADVAR